jgi:hypothetical protein
MIKYLLSYSYKQQANFSCASFVGRIPQRVGRFTIFKEKVRASDGPSFYSGKQDLARTCNVLTIEAWAGPTDVQIGEQIAS